MSDKQSRVHEIAELTRSGERSVALVADGLERAGQTSQQASQATTNVRSHGEQMREAADQVGQLLQGFRV